MCNQTKTIARRKFVQMAGMVAAECYLSGPDTEIAAAQDRGSHVPLFDGKTLNRWIDAENSATSLSVDAVADPSTFASRLASGTDAVSVMLRGKLEPLVKVDLAAYSATNANAKALLSATVKDINQVIAGPLIYDAARFSGVKLRPETEAMLKTSPRGAGVTRLNKLLIEDAYPAELAKGGAPGWVVKDGAIASTGVGRGVLYTAKDYGSYRLIFNFRHASGNPDHYGCVLVFCARSQVDDAPLDALAGVQFGLPNGNHWDYRPGMNNLGDAYFTTVTKTKLDGHAWSQVEILVDAAKGTARMAVAQPPGSKAVEVLDFKDATAGRVGPIALQMHNAGLFDEYKDLSIEVDPKDDRLITTL
jgi:Domain of Unknown Function (DUF1080)